MTDLPAGVRVRPTRDGATYALPRRPLGADTLYGCALGLVGVVIALMAFVTAASTWAERAKAPVVAVAVVTLVAAGMVAFGGWLIVMAAAITVGHCEIEVREDRVRNIERVGPIRWWRSADPRHLRGVEVSTGHFTQRHYGIHLRLQGGRTLTLAPGYPQPMLESLVAVLRRQHRWLVSAPRPAVAPMRAPRPVTEIRFVDDPATAVRAGECQVCGRAMSGEVVSCAKCRTPHHRECWDYNRKCSTFACGSKRFVEGTTAPVDEVVEVEATDLGSAGLGDTLSTLARELGGQMLRHPSRKHRRMRFRRQQSDCTLETWRTRKGYMVELEVEMLAARRAQAGRLFPAERDWLQYRDMGHALMLSPARRLRRTEDVLDFVRRSVAAVDGVL